MRWGGRDADVLAPLDSRSLNLHLPTIDLSMNNTVSLSWQTQSAGLSEIEEGRCRPVIYMLLPPVHLIAPLCNIAESCSEA